MAFKSPKIITHIDGIIKPMAQYKYYKQNQFCNDKHLSHHFFLTFKKYNKIIIIIVSH